MGFPVSTQLHFHVYIMFLLLPTLPCMDADNGDGHLLHNLPCVVRLNQLQCTSAGNSYPAVSIVQFIADNKALLRRMYGELQEPRTVTKTTVRIVRTYGTKSYIAAPLSSKKTFQRPRRNVLEGTWNEMIDSLNNNDEDREIETKAGGNDTDSTRFKRQADFPGAPEQNQDNTKEDVCESKVEITSPYWATNSNGKVRAILNNKEFEQAIHQEICKKSSTLRCNRDCSCEQKYKWHRLLAYDPNNDCGGIFMDWFLFPSCCTCRCSKNPFLG